MVSAPSLSDLPSSYSSVRSMSETLPRPSQRGHMPPVTEKLRRSLTVCPARSMVTAPAPLMEATLKENACADPMCGWPSLLNRMRSMALASVAVPTVDLGSAPIRFWSTMIAVVSPSRTATSGRASVGMKPWTNALYVSLISRCDSAAIVSNTSELFPEPETPVNTVSRRFGISRLMSVRLFSRAPCTLIRSCVSAARGAAGGVCGLSALLIASPAVSIDGSGAGVPGPGRRPRGSGTPATGSAVLQHPEYVAVRVGEGGHETAAANVARLVLHGSARGRHLRQLRLDVRHVPVGDRGGHPGRGAAWHQADVLTPGVEADVVVGVGRRRHAEQRRIDLLGRRQIGDGMQNGLDPLGGGAGRVVVRCAHDSACTKAVPAGASRDMTGGAAC